MGAYGQKLVSRRMWTGTQLRSPGGRSLPNIQNILGIIGFFQIFRIFLDFFGFFSGFFGVYERKDLNTEFEEFFTPK